MGGRRGGPRMDRWMAGNLGTRGATLVKALSRSAMADAVADAVRARSGAPLDGVPEGLTARVLQSAHVIAISAVLDAQDDAWVKQRCEAVGVALGQGLLTETYRAMRDLYRGAASRGEAMLVAVE